ncbi:GNAT family N-acetyltransferase [Crassaminicella thermophila]|uniref:GNAT family N-acetyltransferase n=1 Tax=Crassaminicella thermophila TaxID=2599308 RepID=UPI00143D3B3A|nr:GNAT family N-acetyltransferase [Crassaminicella thermophila]
MKILENIPPDSSQLLELYRTVGWLTFEDDTSIVEEILENTDEFVCIYMGDTLVAFGRMLTDYRMSAFLDDIVVHPGFRHMGFGSIIINILIEKVPKVKKIKLTTFNAAEFYKKFGFSNPSCTPMELILDQK